MTEHAAETDAPYAHRVHVNIGGSPKRPIVTLWCSDCIVTIGDFDQINDWDGLESAVAEHCSQPSRREVLRTTPPEQQGRST